jgi:hypothetical protein
MGADASKPSDSGGIAMTLHKQDKPSCSARKTSDFARALQQAID